VAHDPELEPTAEVSGTNPRTGEVIRMRAPGMVWTSPTGSPVYLVTFSSGHISFRAPNDAVVMTKMFEIAGQLNARIQGDYGEWYEPDGTGAWRTGFPPDDPGTSATTPDPASPFRASRGGRFGRVLRLGRGRTSGSRRP
jgi:hypothetical protein